MVQSVIVIGGLGVPFGVGADANREISFGLERGNHVLIVDQVATGRVHHDSALGHL